MTDEAGIGEQGTSLPWTLVTAAVFGAYAYAVVRTAWMGDDAFITLRTIDNGVNGLGWGFNPQERVQAYTHPLWAMVLTPFYAITREAFFTTLFVSVNLAVGAVALFVWGVASSPGRAIAGVLLLVTSKAFVDFSTSGLENPLSFVLIALLFLTVQRERLPLGWIAFVASLLMLNRLDLALIALPCLGWAIYRAGWRWSVVLGLMPIVLWLIFALVYYGSPLPNTFYAKLGTGIPRTELLAQGSRYFVDSLRHDPITLCTIGLGLISTLIFGNGAMRSIALGGGLYLGYVWWVGGDFMSGRFFSVPLFTAVCLLSSVRMPMVERTVPAYAVVCAVVMMAGFGPVPLFTGRDYGSDSEEIVHGIADERAYYYQGCGLLTAGLRSGRPTHPMAEEGRRLAEGDRSVTYLGAIGMRGYYAGSGLHIVDVNGLSDPLLARLPAAHDDDWRAGHFTRALPDGYLETLRSEQIALTDPAVAEAYGAYRGVVRGPLFVAERWRAIPSYVCFGTGAYGVNLEKYRNAPPAIAR